MTRDCLDIGIIQAFLDGELNHDEAGKVSAHIADCGDCAFAFAEAEDEAAIVFPALDRELNALVPTQRLWNRINDSLAAEKAAMPWWQKAAAFGSLIFANPSLAAAASIIIVVGVFASLWINRVSVAPDQPNDLTIARTNSSLPAPATAVSVVPTDVVEPPAAAPQVQRAAMRTEPRRFAASPAIYRPNPYADTASGEATYVSTISTLSRTVEDKMDGVLRPSQRIAFERDMAVDDDAIAKMKKEVNRNPKNETARQVLYSSYQNKIDLLNSVAQKEELVASIK